MVEENISQKFRLKNISKTWNYQSIIKRKKKNKYDKKVLLVKPKLSNTELLISKALIDHVINHDEFVLINNVPKEYEEMKE